MSTLAAPARNARKSVKPVYVSNFETSRRRRKRSDPGSHDWTTCGCASCHESRREARTLANRQRWDRYQSFETPPHERARRWLMYKGATPLLAELCILYVEVEAAALDAHAKGVALAAQLHSESIVVGETMEEKELVQYQLQGINREDTSISEPVASIESRKLLTDVGLSDSEIAVLSRLNDGNSERETADLCGIDRRQVRHLKKSAGIKLAAHGIDLPPGQPPGRPPKELQRHEGSWVKYPAKPEENN